MPAERTPARWAWLAPVALTAVVWWPITRNYFHFDDFLDLYQLRNDDLLRYLLRMYGGHLLIVRHAVTAVLDALFGPDPRPFFALMLATHLLNTGLLYALVLAATGRWALAALAAALWGVSPANEGALGWWAVYGQVAATTCILAVLTGALHAARAPDAHRRAPLGWALLMFLGGMLFGIGLAAALAMPLAVWLLLPATPLRRRAVLTLVATAAVLLAIYAVLRRLEVPLYGEQRVEITYMLMTLSAAYLLGHVQMLGALLGYGLAMLPLGVVVDPKTFPDVQHGVVIALGALVLLAGVWVAAPVARRRLAAVLLMLAAVYGLIALGRSLFASVYGLLTMAGSLRFHYGAGALLAAALALALAALATRWRPPRALATGAAALAALWIAGSALAIPRRYNHFDGDRRETVKVLTEIRAAIDAAPPGSTVEIPNRMFGSVGYVNVGYRDRFPGTAAVFVIFFPDNVVDGRRVVFTSADPLVLKGARGRRSASLLRELPAPEPADKDRRS